VHVLDFGGGGWWWLGWRWFMMVGIEVMCLAGWMVWRNEMSRAALCVYL
jgi:hypothetical protein